MMFPPKPPATTRPSRPRLALHLSHALLNGWRPPVAPLCQRHQHHRMRCIAIVTTTLTCTTYRLVTPRLPSWNVLRR